MNAVNQSTKGIKQRRREAAKAGRRKILRAALLLVGLCMSYAAARAYHGKHEEAQAAHGKSQAKEPAAPPSQTFAKKFLFGMIADSAPAERQREIQEELGRQRKAMEEHADLSHQLNWKRYIIDDAKGDGFYPGMEPDKGQIEAAAAPPAFAVATAGDDAPAEHSPDGAGDNGDDHVAAEMPEGTANSPDKETIAVSQVSMVAAAFDEWGRDESPVPEQIMPQQQATMAQPLVQVPPVLSEAAAIVPEQTSMPESQPQQTGSPEAAQQLMPAEHSQEPEYAVLEQAEAGVEELPVISTVAVETAPFVSEAAQENGSCDEIIRSMDAAVLDDFYYAIAKLRESQTVLKGTGGSVYRVMPTSIRGRCMEYDVQAEIGGSVLLCRDTACMGG